MLIIQTLKSKISYLRNSNTCCCSRLYGILAQMLCNWVFSRSKNRFRQEPLVIINPTMSNNIKTNKAHRIRIISKATLKTGTTPHLQAWKLNFYEALCSQIYCFNGHNVRTPFKITNSNSIVSVQQTKMTFMSRTCCDLAFND